MMIKFLKVSINIDEEQTPQGLKSKYNYCTLFGLLVKAGEINTLVYSKVINKKCTAVALSKSEVIPPCSVEITAAESRALCESCLVTKGLDQESITAQLSSYDKIVAASV